jgi:hypothetical protein
MLNVTQNYLNAVSHYTRDIVTRVYFNDSETPIQGDLMRVQIKELGQSSEALTLGDLCTNEATVKFIMPSVVIPLEGGKFRVEHGIKVGDEYNFIPMGTFYISQIEEIEGARQFTITGYDRSKRLEKEYVPTVTLPTTVEAIVRDICTQCNIVLDESFVFPEIAIETMYEGNCKETLKYMAGLMGKNAKINRDDKLTFYWYTLVGSTQNEATSILGQAILGVMTLGNAGTPMTRNATDMSTLTYRVRRSMQYMSGFKKNTSDDFVINSLTSGTEENPLVSGNGRGITFNNPYMTQEILDGIYDSISGFSYSPSTTKYNGNPCLEIGDMILVEDSIGRHHNIIVGGHDIVLTGMNATITSKGSTEADLVMKQSPTEIKLNKMYNTLQQSFKNSTELITGAKGGHFVITKDENGYPTGFQIMDTPTLTDNTKLWIFNKNGLGFSEDGGVTLKNFALDLFGNLNANVITTGALQGDYFELNLSTGSLILGKRGSNGNFEEEWVRADQSGLYMSFPNNSNFASKNDLEDLDKKYAEENSDLRANFEFNDEGISIGRGDFKVNISETELYFSQFGEKIAYLSNNKLFITKVQVTESMAFGKDGDIVYEWVIRKNKHLTLRVRESDG